jgi:ubiquinone/menaquinone biosynthesis C-methylase UbiE
MLALVAKRTMGSPALVGEMRWRAVRGWAVPSVEWGHDLADVYDSVYPASEALDSMVDLLADLAGDEAALEFAVGTGRVALPLSERGVQVHGIELSGAMADQLRRKPGAEKVHVTVGDMTSTRVAGRFRLVYLVANSIMNVTTQDEQLAVLRNAAAHLDVGGVFIVAVVVPQLREVPVGAGGRVFTLDADHIGVETFDDPVGQVAWSHHWMMVDGRLVRHSAPYRYLWPSELDLMARLAGLRLRARWADWDKAPFTAASSAQVVVYEKEH